MQVRLKIEGMHCAGCARAVQSVLSSVDHVESAVIDLAASEALVVATDAVDLAALIAAIDEAGYGASLATGR
jgi:Cu+-exporting ATPase